MCGSQCVPIRFLPGAFLVFVSMHWKEFPEYCHGAPSSHGLLLKECELYLGCHPFPHRLGQSDGCLGITIVCVFGVLPCGIIPESTAWLVGVTLDNVLKPVPQPPLEPELDLNKASGTKLFWGRPCHVDAQHGPKQEAGVQGGGTAPLVGSGAKPQKPAMICTYYNQLYNGKCYSCTQLSTLHFVINLLEPACDMLARGWPRAGTRN